MQFQTFGFLLLSAIPFVARVFDAPVREPAASSTSFAAMQGFQVPEYDNGAVTQGAYIEPGQSFTWTAWPGWKFQQVDILVPRDNDPNTNDASGTIDAK